METRKRQGSLCTVKRPREVHDNTKRETSHVAWRRATRGHYLVPVVRALPSKHGPSVGRAALGQRSIHLPPVAEHVASRSCFCANHGPGRQHGAATGRYFLTSSILPRQTTTGSQRRERKERRERREKSRRACMPCSHGQPRASGACSKYSAFNRAHESKGKGAGAGERSGSGRLGHHGAVRAVFSRGSCGRMDQGQPRWVASYRGFVPWALHSHPPHRLVRPTPGPRPPTRRRALGVREPCRPRLRLLLALLPPAPPQQGRHSSRPFQAQTC